MNLKSILNGLDYEVLQGTEDKEIGRIIYDSRKVCDNDLFVCVKGYSTDGHKYADNAVSRGAKVIVLQDDINIENKDITIIKCNDTRKALAVMGANY